MLHIKDPLSCGAVHFWGTKLWDGTCIHACFCTWIYNKYSNNKLIGRASGPVSSFWAIMALRCQSAPPLSQPLVCNRIAMSDLPVQHPVCRCDPLILCQRLAPTPLTAWLQSLSVKLFHLNYTCFRLRKWLTCGLRAGVCILCVLKDVALCSRVAFSCSSRELWWAVEGLSPRE